MKKLMLGNEAIARGAYEAGVAVVSAYPGTPSTEITESIAKFGEVYAEWAPNEKVAMEVAIGASFAGARSMACMKHVGLNVAADPMFTLSYSGVNAGLVIVVADDPGMHSSQNEQDSRCYAKAAHIPMLEPSDSAEAKRFVKIAFNMSEKYDTPVLVRTTTRVAHSQSEVELLDRKELRIKEYKKDITKYTLMPSTAKLRRKELELRDERLRADCNTFPINEMKIRSKELGVVCSGIVYQYVREALPEASVLKLGMVHPLPIKLIGEFAKQVDKLLVIEELEPFIEEQIKAVGISCRGKDVFPVHGEITVPVIRERLFGAEIKKGDTDMPVRPPVMCAGCPHRGVFYVLNKLKLTVNSDIGCYTLGAQPPLSAVDTVICMGASIPMAHGFAKALKNEGASVAVIGDSTFIHSGITGLINAVYNKSAITVIILDNSTTGMTGHQDHPATGKTISGEPTAKLNLATLVAACGAARVDTADAYDINELERLIKEHTALDEVSVIIARQPCALLYKGATEKYFISDSCKKCLKCLQLGCPAISKNEDGGVSIDCELCTGCGLCAALCPFGAIIKETIN